jgi:hypothetical protein
MELDIVRFNKQNVARIAVLILTCCGTQILATDIFNYENDPDLAAAIGYDSETNGGNRHIASQQLAEKHYLAYLQRARDPDQRARVYVQLGVLFSTNWHKEAGEKPDYQKARVYFQEAIRCAPNRVGIPMIRARLGMATPLQSREERLDLRIETYHWMNSIDPRQAHGQWLRSRPDRGPSDTEVSATIGVLRNVQLAEQDNILDEAQKSVDPLRSLQMVAVAFPGTDLANRANLLRQGLLHGVMDPMIDRSMKEIGNDAAAIKGEAEHSKLRGTSITGPIQAADSGTSGYSLIRVVVIATAVALAVVLGRSFYLVIRRRQVAKNH